MRKVVVKDITFGEGMPKICVPLVGKNKSEIIEELEQVSWDSVDLLEWRLDHFENLDNWEEVLSIADMISSEYPLLVTFRTVFEGGNRPITNEQYVALYKKLIDAQVVDMIDIEYQLSDVVKPLIAYAHEHGVYVVLSYHNFDQTPCEELLLQHLQNMQRLQGDICKIAVMPNEKMDVLEVMHTAITWKGQAQTPYLVLSMDAIGMITRIAAEFMGCCMTFGKGLQQSAPGQLSKEQLQEALMWLHQK